jgi:hypothetical protein
MVPEAEGVLVIGYTPGYGVCWVKVKTDVAEPMPPDQGAHPSHPIAPGGQPGTPSHPIAQPPAQPGQPTQPIAPPPGQPQPRR